MKVGIIEPIGFGGFGVSFDSFAECEVRYYNIMFCSLPIGEPFMWQGDSYMKTEAEQGIHEDSDLEQIFEGHWGILIDEDQYERLGLTDENLVS
jgi:hypothetical protein